MRSRKVDPLRLESRCAALERTRGGASWNTRSRPVRAGRPPRGAAVERPFTVDGEIRMTSSATDVASAEPRTTVKRLPQYYHPIARSEEVTEELNVFQLLGEDVLVYRNSQGQPVAFKDLCIHRGTRLSLG